MDMTVFRVLSVKLCQLCPSPGDTEPSHTDIIWSQITARDDGYDLEHPKVCDDEENPDKDKCILPQPKSDFGTVPHASICVRIALLVDLSDRLVGVVVYG